MAQPEKKRNLGRGLSALIPPKPVDGPPPTGLTKLSVQEVLPSDSQPRQVFDEDGIEELAQSIKKHGILQPIVVRRRGAGRYELVAGERRWRAAQRAGRTHIEAVVTEVADEDTLTLALVENLQRRDLNPIEEAEAYARLHQDLGYSQVKIAEAVGKDRSTVANALRLLRLPEQVRTLVLEGDLNMGHARAVLSLADEDAMAGLAQQAATEGWSVRRVEDEVAQQAQQAQPEKKKSAKRRRGESQAERDVRMRLQRALHTKVELKDRGGKGAITIHYGSYDELDRLLERFEGSPQ